MSTLLARFQHAYFLLRSTLYRIALASYYGKKLVLHRASQVDYHSKIHIFANGRVELGEGAALRSSPRGYHGGMPFSTTILVDRDGASVTINSKCRLNGTYVHAQESVQIGKNCVIAAGVNIMDSNGHELISTNRTVGRDTPIPIEIGENVWIGINAIILKGTIIGNNCVVGANSVVSGIFPDNSLIMGNPAQVIKTLAISSNAQTAQQV